MSRPTPTHSVLLVVLLCVPTAFAAEPTVDLIRVPHGGIQPQVAVDSEGAVHLVYFAGKPEAGDLFYTRSRDGGATFEPAIQVNRHSGSAIAGGNIRGAHLALGRGGRAHVAWMGSAKARPRAALGESPMLYTRLADDGTAFEPERNLIQHKFGLDGGGSIAADGEGRVHVVWHAFDRGKRDEANRRVWIRTSSDDGATFSAERAAWSEPTGTCGCCGMRAGTDAEGNLYLLYRGARETVHRDLFLLTSRDGGERFAGKLLSPWEVGQCIMSTACLVPTQGAMLAAWETEEQVYFARIEPGTTNWSKPIAAPGTASRRKYPVVAADQQGQVLLAWTEGMEWMKGGRLAWQVFDRDGRPIPGRFGGCEGVPPWSLVAAWARADGGFVLVY